MRIYKISLTGLFLLLLLQFSACKQAKNSDTTTDRDLQQAENEQKGLDNAGQGNTVTLSPDQYKSLAISLGALQKKNLSSTIQVSGTVAVPPQNLASVTFPYGGSVKSTMIQEGRSVRKGELLATLENPEFVQLQQDYLESRSQWEFLKTEYERQQMLSAQNINAKKSLEKAKAEFTRVQGQLKGLKARLVMINIDMASLESGNIQQTVPVYAPISGVVAQININRGSYVTPSDVMLRIINSDNMYIELSVFEKDISKVYKGQSFSFFITDSAVRYDGAIHLVGKEIRADKSIAVHGGVLSKNMHGLTAGMYVRAIIKTTTKEVNALPDEAIVDFLGKKYIFLQASAQGNGAAQKNYTFTMVEVKVGLSEGGFTEITPSGDFEGKADNIVLKGAYGLLSTSKNSAQEE